MKVKMENVLFILTRDDLRCMLEEMHLDPDLADDAQFFRGVKKGLMWGLDHWSDTMRIAIQDILFDKKKGGKSWQ